MYREDTPLVKCSRQQHWDIKSIQQSRFPHNSYEKKRGGFPTFFLVRLLFYNIIFYAGIFKKWIEGACSGLLWLRIGIGGWCFWMRWCNFGVHKMWEISWLAKDPLTSHEVLCCMDILIYYISIRYKVLVQCDVFCLKFLNKKILPSPL